MLVYQRVPDISDCDPCCHSRSHGSLAIFCAQGHGSALSYADVKLKADKAGNCLSFREMGHR